MAIGVAFIITIVIALISGIYLLRNVGLIAPIIGGLIAGYMVGGSFTNGLVNGGIPAGIAGAINSLFEVWVLNKALATTVISTALVSAGYTGSPERFLIIAAIGSAFVGFAIFFVLGIIGAIIGVAIKKRGTEKPKPIKSPEQEPIEK
jgi:Family of unknown function (DUF5518)